MRAVGFSWKPASTNAGKNQQPANRPKTATVMTSFPRKSHSQFFDGQPPVAFHRPKSAGTSPCLAYPFVGGDREQRACHCRRLRLGAELPSVLLMKKSA